MGCFPVNIAGVIGRIGLGRFLGAAAACFDLGFEKGFAAAFCGRGGGPDLAGGALP